VVAGENATNSKTPLRDAAETPIDDRVKVERLTVLGMLASRLSGELRQPLSVMRNAVYYMNQHLDPKLDDKERRHLGILLVEMENMNSIIANLTGLTASGRIERQDVEVEVLVATAMDRIVRPGRVTYSVTVPPGITVFCDPFGVSLALRDIINNAIEALAGAGRVDVLCRQTPVETTIEVTDDGPGMSEEVRARAFEPMFTTSPHRVGIGLTVAQRLVGASAGAIEIRSAPAKGTTVLIRFPRHGTTWP
jgi:signal transduction histidine kinase